jgi:glycosyltransferase involved in cell wall biosynthesis
MKIAIVTLTTTARRTGVAEILINLFRELQRIDRTNEYFLFTGRDNRYMFSFTNPNFKEIVLPLSHSPGLIMRPLFHFWQIFILPVWCYRNGINLIHLPNTLYVSSFFPTVSSILDVVELKTKKYSSVRTFFRKVMINSAIRNAKKIMTISESSASDLSAMGARNVIPIHLGFDNPFLQMDLSNEEAILKKYSLTGISYVLFIGTLLKHKNIPTLLEAFHIVKEKILGLKLVLVGAPDNDAGNIQHIITALNLEQDVLLLSFVSQEEKLIILRNAKVFAFISSYEGFGIPILEAQAAGVPVIANNVSSLPEVGGKGVFLVNHEKLKEETADAIQSLIENEQLRRELINLGYNNIIRFSWEFFSRKTLEVYTQFGKTQT